MLRVWLSSLLLAAAAAAGNGSNCPILDLSLPLNVSADYNNNAVHDALLDAVSLPFPSRLVRGYLLLQNGTVLAEYYREDEFEDEVAPIYSVTKTWAAMIIGVLQAEGRASVDMTLGEIFPSPFVWLAVKDAAAKQNITLEALLTMSSGLVDPRESFLVAVAKPQDTLVLNHADYVPEEAGLFNYVATTQLLSYVVTALSGGLPPLEFALDRNVFADLGINASQFNWRANDEAVELSAYGLAMTLRQMVKVGLLYLQGGLAAEDVRVVTEDWVRLSTTAIGDGRGPEAHPDGADDDRGHGYGFQLWLTPFRGAQDYCAMGMGGQRVCVFPDADAVLAIQTRVSGAVTPTSEADDLVDIAAMLLQPAQCARP
ncbi:beta-lactamase/transpeptidase-like protein [Pelagophyceae sp. CCMP2097]|nr:beta-lactamase/transpeptidase-like protein [Pelagophyceae sp. CCMP2097]